MDKLRELQLEYLKNVMNKRGITSPTALAREINIWPSTLNKFLKSDNSSQNYLSAPTLDKLHKLSGITPPTTSNGNRMDYEVNPEILAKAIAEVVQLCEEQENAGFPKSNLEQRCKLIAVRYNKKIIESRMLLKDVNKLDNKG